MKGPMHHVDTGTLFSNTIGEALHRKNCTEHAVNPIDDQDCHGRNYSFIPPAENPSAKGVDEDDSHVKDQRNTSPENDEKLSCT